MEQNTNKTNLKHIIFLITLASCLRIAFNLFYDINATPGIDGIVLDKVAYNLATGHGYSVYPGIPTAKKPPAFILIMSLIYKIFGTHNYTAVRIFLIIFSSLTPFLVYLIARNTVNEETGLISAALAAISPLLIYNSWWVLSNTFMYFTLALGVYLLTLPMEKLKPPVFLACGLCIGLATLSVQYGTAFYFPLPFIWAYYKFPKNRLKNALLITLGIFIPVSIWMARNYIAFKKVIYNNTESGVRFWGGNNPRADGNWLPWIGSARFFFDSQKPGWHDASNWIELSEKMGYPFQELVLNKKDTLSEPEINGRYFKLAIDWIKNNPIKYFKLLGKKFLILWHPFSKHSVSPFLSNTFRNISFLFELIILPFFLLGIAASIKQWKNYIFLYLLIIHQIIIALYHFGDIQQRMRVGSFILIFSALGIYSAKNTLTRLKKGQYEK
ncbi:MAG: glycosyltransferase family 39 protein [bacterium]